MSTVKIILVGKISSKGGSYTVPTLRPAQSPPRPQFRSMIVKQAEGPKESFLSLALKGRFRCDCQFSPMNKYSVFLFPDKLFLQSSVQVLSHPLSCSGMINPSPPLKFCFYVLFQTRKSSSL